MKQTQSYFCALILAFHSIVLSSLSFAAEAEAGQAVASSTDLNQAEAARSSDIIERWSKEDKSLGPRALRLSEFNKAIADLQASPRVSVPLLVDRFADRTRDRTFRTNCGQMLREMGATVPSQHLKAMRAMIGDAREDSALRIFAAHFLLRDKVATAADEKAILDLAERTFRTGGDKANVGLLIMLHLRGNGRATQIMLDELKRGTDPGPTFHILGKVGHPSAIGPIERILRDRFSDRSFAKTRAYLALGEIGGSRAYDTLLSYLAKEKDEREQHMLVRGLGLTRDPRAKAQLFRYLSDGPDHFYTSALRALQYYGDPSVIPDLERELARQTDIYLQQRIRSTITALREGRTSAEW